MCITMKLIGFLVMAFAITACLMLNAGTANADGKMYVMNGDGGVTVANLDGTGANFYGLGGQTGGIAFDAVHEKIYATVEPDNRLFVANSDGTGGVYLAYVEGPGDNPAEGILNYTIRDIALDAIHGKIYGTSDNNSIVEENLDRTGPVNLGNLNGTLSDPGGIALDLVNGKMYVLNPDINTVSVANLDGTGGVNLGNLGGTLDFPWGIALDTDHGKMYVTNYHNNTVSVANLDGTGGESLGDLNGTLVKPTGIAVDMAGGKIYVTNEGVDNIDLTTTSSVVAANLDGTGGTSLGNLGGILANTHEVPLGIALNVFYNLTVSANPAANGSVTLSAQGPYQPDTQVTLTAKPAQGCQFTGWSGYAETMENPLTVTMNKDMSITANFAANAPLTTTATVNGTAGANGWYVSNVGISFSALGVKEICTKLDNRRMTVTAGSAATLSITSEGYHKVTYYAVDNAGNQESPHTLNINIDKTPPAIKITGIRNGAVYILGRTIPTARYTATDKLCGLASKDAALTGGNANHAGIFTYTVNATDNAGNTAVKSATYSVRYVFSKFLPLRGKVFTTGSAVSVTFQLKDAKGNYISTASATLMLKSPGGVPVTPASGTNTGNVFQYDPTANRYVYSLNTVGLATGKWQLQVMLDDGSPVKTLFINLK
ncbi:MAG: PxKF domain-containing protein [Nitrospirota bacterium]